MIRISFHFCRSAHVAFHQQTNGDATFEHGRGVKKRLARDDLFGSAHVGNDLLGWQFRAGGESGKRRGCGHQFQHLATIQPSFRRLRCSLRLLSGINGKFVVQKGLVFRRAGNFIQAAPEAFSAFLPELPSNSFKIERRPCFRMHQ